MTTEEIKKDLLEYLNIFEHDRCKILAIKGKYPGVVYPEGFDMNYLALVWSEKVQMYCLYAFSTRKNKIYGYLAEYGKTPNILGAINEFKRTKNYQ